MAFTQNGINNEVSNLGVGSAASTTAGIGITQILTGSTTCQGISNAVTFGAGVTGVGYTFFANSSVAASVSLSNCWHYRAGGVNLGSGAAVADQRGFFVDSNLTNATNNYAFYGAVPAASNAWNLYMSGTSQNYLAGLSAFGPDTSVATAVVHASASTTSRASMRMTAGTAPTSPNGGDMWNDGVSHYHVSDTTSGTATVNAQQYFRLASTGSAISSTANYFGTTSNISLASGGTYEIEIEAWYLKTTAGTITWSFVFNTNVTEMNLLYAMSPIGGIVSTQASSVLFGQQYGLTGLLTQVVTGSLTSGVNHYNKFKIFLFNSTATSMKIEVLPSAGTITPGIGSRWTCRRLPANSTGTFAA